MDFKFGNLIFSSNFDSGNLLNVEKIVSGEDNNSQSETIKIDYDFNIWTKPDCHGTEYENGNRTWFYFSVKGYLPGKMIRITIKNLNRQQRLYAQGYCPLFKTETNNKDNEKWCRVRYRPTWENNETNFQLTFTHRLSEVKASVTYFAFCYPWSYSECQRQLEALDVKYNHCASCSWDVLSQFDRRTIYYKRELFTKTIEGKRVDLLTITDLEGLQNEREEIYDQKLFPDKGSRPWKFSHKKVFVVTSRVHPGETPSSHVFNGFLNFILRPDDARSIQLRKQYIFKLIPLLNPDGVFRGHYRTDVRGVNLNRVYLNPDIEVHSPIYAAKSLLVYHHIYNSDEPNSKLSVIKTKVFNDLPRVSQPNNNSTRTPEKLQDNQIQSKEGTNMDSERKVYIISGNRVTEVAEIPVPSMYGSGSDNPLDCKDSQRLTDNILPTARNSATHLPMRSNESAMKSKHSNSENLLIEDCSEVFVDTDSLRCDLESPSDCIKTAALLAEPKNPTGDNMTSVTNDFKFDLHSRDSIDTDNIANLNQTINKIFNPPNRSNSIPAINIKGHQLQWNVKGAHANIVNSGDVVSSDCRQQAIRLHKKQKTSMIPLPLRPSIVSMRFASKKPGKVSLDPNQLSSMKGELPACNGYKAEPRIGNEGSDDDSDLECYVGRNGNAEDSLHLCDPCLLEIPFERSGIAFYVDLHGHCSKRGCFMYGNCLENEKDMNDNVLYPKLISLNSPHFDFLGCNFSLKNMYAKDKKDGTSKEGAGRVAIGKHLGLVHSYTLECNYNTGRTINSIPPTAKDDGRASPPLTDQSSLLPPKYTTAHFEDVGKAMAIAALDITHTNPWSRIINSEYSTLQNIREFVRRFLVGQRNGVRPSISFRHRYKGPVRQPSSNGIPSISKSLSNQLDNRRGNGSQNFVSMSAPRKIQTSITPNLTHSNSNSIKPIVLNAQQTNIDADKVSNESGKDRVSNGTSDQSSGNFRTTSSVTSVSSKIDPFSKSEASKPINRYPESGCQKLSCNSAQIVSKMSSNQEAGHLVKYAPMTLKSDDENYINKRRENSDTILSSESEIFRRNSIADCYPDETLYDILEREKLDELKEILSDEKCFKGASPGSKTDPYSFSKRSFQLRKSSPAKKKVLGKIISYSTNDINY